MKSLRCEWDQELNRPGVTSGKHVAVAKFTVTRSGRRYFVCKECKALHFAAQRGAPIPVKRQRYGRHDWVVAFREIFN